MDGNKIAVTIEWDKPNDPFSLTPDKIKLALEAYCPDSRFVVRELLHSTVDSSWYELDYRKFDVSDDANPVNSNGW